MDTKRYPEERRYLAKTVEFLDREIAKRKARQLEGPTKRMREPSRNWTTSVSQTTSESDPVRISAGLISRPKVMES